MLPRTALTSRPFSASRSRSIPTLLRGIASYVGMASTFAVCCYMSLPAMAASSLLPKPVENAVSKRVARGDYPALIIAVVDGQQSRITPFGQLGNGQRLDEDTEFEVGSVTKTLTALMLAQLVRSGSVQLDEPVGTLLDGWQFPSHGGKVITLEELATQRSGLPRLPDNFAPTDRRNPYADYGPRQLKAFLSHYELSRAPGAQYEYSNVGFGLLGYALACAQHTAYAQLVKERVLRPLQMNESDFILDNASRTRLARGHDARGRIAGNWDPGVLAGAGGLRSTARDMLRYLQANMGELPTSLYPAMKLAQQPRADTSEQRRRIGLAWMTDSVGGSEVIWHNGMTGGYASFIGFTSNRKRGVVVLTNISKDVTDIGLAWLVPSVQNTMLRH